MLLLIKEFLKERKSANLQELSLHFSENPENIRSLMVHWIRKGRVRHQKKLSVRGCGTKCQNCSVEVYQWING